MGSINAIVCASLLSSISPLLLGQQQESFLTPPRLSHNADGSEQSIIKTYRRRTGDIGVQLVQSSELFDAVHELLTEPTAPLHGEIRDRLQSINTANHSHCVAMKDSLHEISRAFNLRAPTFRHTYCTTAEGSTVAEGGMHPKSRFLLGISHPGSPSLLTLRCQHIVTRLVWEGYSITFLEF